MTVSVEIRKATEDDRDAILECLQLAFAPYESSYTPGAYLDTVLTSETLHHRLKTMSVFVACGDSGKVLGTIACQAVIKHQGHLRGMAVHPTWQGTGIALSLLKRAESELRSLGCNRVTLDTTGPLQRAMRFYERNGYRPTGSVTDFYGMPLFEYAKAL
jgi:GNAT superfamily N-acetyltransferase